MAEVEQDFVEIVDDNLDIKKYTDLVRSPAAGAIATFIGTTRDTFEDKQVLELRYEAYIPMALRQLRAICSAARNRWKLIRLAVAHRLGVVPVGEESVFIAVSSVHRRDALEACEYVIDEIKASVPIWKKEVYTNGEVWKENSEFFLRKPGESGKESSLKQHKAHEHSRCCGRKERVFENGTDDNSHSRFEVVEGTEKESNGDSHCAGDVIDEIKASAPIWKKEVYTNGEVWKENSEFFLRKPGESGKDSSLKQHKAHDHSRCCGRKKRVFENGTNDNSHSRFEVVEGTEKESNGDSHCAGDVISNSHMEGLKIDALEACEDVIDEIKASVPIWKKEVYTNGEVWKENSEFFLRKPGESGKESSLKQHKAHQHSRCCGHKERVFENGTNDNSHSRFEVLEGTEKESNGDSHCAGDGISKSHIKGQKIDAFEACEDVIDEIKASVPIWKKEVYANSEVWKENSEFFLRKPGESGKKSEIA